MLTAHVKGQMFARLPRVSLDVFVCPHLTSLQHAYVQAKLVCVHPSEDNHAKRNIMVQELAGWTPADELCAHR